MTEFERSLFQIALVALISKDLGTPLRDVRHSKTGSATAILYATRQYAATRADIRQPPEWSGKCPAGRLKDL